MCMTGRRNIKWISITFIQTYVSELGNEVDVLRRISIPTFWTQSYCVTVDSFDLG